VTWDPLGRGFILGGFGNLPGDMDFWVRGDEQFQTNNKNQKTASTSRTPIPAGTKTQLIKRNKFPCCTRLQWTTDGQHVVCSAGAPRRTIDNYFGVFDYLGDQIFERKMMDGVEKVDHDPEKAVVFDPNLLFCLAVNPRVTDSIPKLEEARSRCQWSEILKFKLHWFKLRVKL
jgi:hypothetical protein